MNPNGEYELVITAGGNTAFDLFVSKSTNTGVVLGTRSYNGTLNVGYSKHLHLNADNMNLSSEVDLSTALLPIAGIVVALLGFIGIIAGVLFFRRKRVED